MEVWGNRLLCKYNRGGSGLELVPDRIPTVKLSKDEYSCQWENCRLGGFIGCIQCCGDRLVQFGTTTYSVWQTLENPATYYCKVSMHSIHEEYPSALSCMDKFSKVLPQLYLNRIQTFRHGKQSYYVYQTKSN